jgi:hypothetical protein
MQGCYPELRECRHIPLHSTFSPSQHRSTNTTAYRSSVARKDFFALPPHLFVSTRNRRAGRREGFSVVRDAAVGAGLHAPESGVRAYQAFDLGDWAWEFLRRNADYRSDSRAATPRTLHCIRLRDGTRLLRLHRRYPRAERWGLYAFADPSHQAPEVPVFWLPGTSQRFVRAHCEMVSDARLAVHVVLQSFRAERYAIIDADGLPVIWMRSRGGTVGLVASGWHVLTRPAIVTFELEAFEEFASRIECLEALRRLSQGGLLLSVDRLPINTSERLHHALLALDGSLAGYSYREIATAIFGERRVANDWNAASRSLKDRMRRLVAKGHRLMNGGYRDLLR